MVCGAALSAAALTLAVAAEARTPALKPTSRVSSSGLGPVKIGMTKGQAERAAGTRIVYSGAGMNDCRYARPRNRSIKASFMLTDGRIARVDVHKRGIATPSGVRVGDSESTVRRRFAGQLRITRHAYTTGWYLEFVPRDAKDRNRRVIFETDGETVRYIRAGRLPEARYIEGCA